MKSTLLEYFQKEVFFMNKNQILNVKYACVNAAYLMLICATSGYAYNYLSQCGFTDGQTGTIITVISILGVLGQTFFGSIIDKSKYNRPSDTC